MTDKPRKTKLFWRTGLRVVFALVLFAILFQFIDPHQVLLSFEQADGLLIAAAAILLVFNIGFQVVKWRYLLHESHILFPWPQVTKSLLFGITAGTLTPGQIGEFGGRAFNLTSDHPERIIGLTIIDKLQMLAVMIIGGGVSFPILFNLNLSLTFAILLAVILVSVLLLRPSLFARMLRKTGLGRVQNKWIREFLQVVDSIHRPALIAVSVLLTVLFYCTIWIQLHLLLNAFAFVTPVDSFLGFASMMLAKAALPLTFADLGTREIGLVYFLSLRSVPEAVAFNAGILLFAINILTPALIGLLFIPRSFSLRKP